MQALGRALDWLGVSRREDRIECACGRDHRAKRASNFSHAFTPEMLQEARKQAGTLMAKLGYDLEQTQLKAVPEFGLPALTFPSQRRQQRERHGLLQGHNDDDLDAQRGITTSECGLLAPQPEQLLCFVRIIHRRVSHVCADVGTRCCFETTVDSRGLPEDQAS